LNADPKTGRFDTALNIIVAIVMSIAAVFCWILLSLGLYDFLGGIKSQPFEWNKVFAIVVFGWLTMITTYITWWCIRSPAVPKGQTSMNPWLLWSSVLIVCAGFGLSLYTNPGKLSFSNGHDWAWVGVGLFYIATVFRRKSK